MQWKFHYTNHKIIFTKISCSLVVEILFQPNSILSLHFNIMYHSMAKYCVIHPIDSSYLPLTTAQISKNSIQILPFLSMITVTSATTENLCLISNISFHFSKDYCAFCPSNFTLIISIPYIQLHVNLELVTMHFPDLWLYPCISAAILEISVVDHLFQRSKNCKDLQISVSFKHFLP